MDSELFWIKLVAFVPHMLSHEVTTYFYILKLPQLLERKWNKHVSEGEASLVFPSCSCWIVQAALLPVDHNCLTQIELNYMCISQCVCAISVSIYYVHTVYIWFTMYIYIFKKNTHVYTRFTYLLLFFFSFTDVSVLTIPFAAIT